ncbi:MAG: tRNA (adenosine(37)-N6)-threonylcarbamoyltransferase complex transferase subunit TsaD [Fibrobacterota bacterium]
MIVLGVETSCDETSVALIRDGAVAANEIYTQQVHTEFGGVVPEIASREHIKKVDLLCRSVLKTCRLRPSDIDLIAVTDRPGLAGALLVGISFVRGLSAAYGIPCIGVNHLEGHIAAVTLENSPAFPFIALVASGGHTSIYRVEAFGRYELLGQTVDDAAGEAFDKVGKLLGFSYPAGHDIEECARTWDGSDYIPFSIAEIKRYAGHNFSFSGLKTAVKYHVETYDSGDVAAQKGRICASFQNAVIRAVLKNLTACVQDTGISDIALVGGVACNQAIRAALRQEFGEEHVFFPSPRLCTDNGAMIAKAGLESYNRGIRRSPRMEPTAKITGRSK